MEKHSKEKVFITGISGFTGVYLEKYLVKKGFNVFGTSFKHSNNPNHFVCNIINLDELCGIINTIKPSYIIHLAAISFVATKDLDNLYKINIFGTLNLLEALKNLKLKPKKIIIASTAAVYGNIEGVLTEEICPKPVNHYGNSKMVMENMVKQYFSSQNIIITRPFNYTGSGQDESFLIPKIIKHYKLNKKVIELGNIDTFREYNDIDFVVESYYRLMQIKANSITVNICTGKTKSIKQILEIMDKICNYKIQVKINTDFVRKNEIKELRGSTNNLFRLLGFKMDDNKYDIEKVLKKMYLN